MRRNQSWRWGVAGLGAVALGALAWSVNAAEDRGGSAPSQAQMMAQYMALAEPGPEHRALADMAGDWDATCISYCDPSGVPQTFTGEQESEMILGRRFLKSEYKGEMMGVPFEGVSLTGYDNIRKKYVSLWADTMSTMWMTAEGEADASGKIVTLVGSYDDPVTGKTMEMRQVVTMLDKNTHKFEMYGPNPQTGEEMLMMEITYRRD